MDRLKFKKDAVIFEPIDGEIFNEIEIKDNKSGVCYFASNFGRIVSYKQKVDNKYKKRYSEQRLITKKQTCSGRNRINIISGNVSTTLLSDIVVFMAFNKKCNINNVFHIDGDNSNDNIDNLVGVFEESKKEIKKITKNDLEERIETIIKKYEAKIINNNSDYYIFKDGRIFSYRSMKFIKPHIARNGYINICLHGMSSQKNFSIHRLIAQAFIPNPENKPEVNHIDGNRSNNKISNLEWCTRSENGLHAYAVNKRSHPMTGLLGINNKKSKIVYAYKNGVCVDAFFGLSDAQRKTGISSGHISQACNGIRNTARGYVWKF